jgi:phage-related protein
MDAETCIVYQGQCFTVEWYYDKNGNSQAYDYFLSTDQMQKRKFLVLIKKIGDFGKIFDKTKFRNEGDGIYAFKPKPDRYLSCFMKDKKIIITNAFMKKTRKLPTVEKDLAEKYRKDYIERNHGGK